MPEVGTPIASGRAADVFAYGEGRVLRRYRTPVFLLYEAAVMQWVAAHGYPVPKVYEASGTDLVMERLEGPTMLRVLPKKPHQIGRHAVMIARLMKQLHEIPPPPWLVPKHTAGSAIVHLDLHPDNVMLTPRGPVVIDWTNAGLGDPDVEVADLWLVTACATAPGSALERAVIGLGRKIFVRALLKEFDRDAISAKLPVAAEQRSRDRNMSEAEKERMQRLVERYALRH